MKLSISNLGKQYRRDFWGLQEFSLDVQPGILGLFGPNGAAKSTFIRMLATITKPTEGNIHWNDVNIVKSPDVMRAVLGRDHKSRQVVELAEGQLHANG